MRRVVDGLGQFTGRGACTDAERRAALWLHGELRARGREAWVETRWVRPHRAAALALACLAAVAGGLDERGIAPRAHQPDDLPEHVGDDAMEAALAFALEDAERREVLERL